jgi:hypothetical protein
MLSGCFAVHTSALWAEGELVAGEPKVGACALLTRELVMQVSPYEEQPAEQRDLHRQLLTQLPPSEEPVGPSGSACDYGGIHLQIDPFAAPARTEEEIAKLSVSLPGLGDVAYFSDNHRELAELYVRFGPRVMTIQMDTPPDRTPESIKSNAVALAKALLPKLQ